MDDSTKTILVVDDKPANLKVLLGFLKDNNFQVYIADSGARTLSTLENVQPDLILLDIMMPEMDGLETCRQIKKEEKWHTIPIIFMTALDDIADKLAGFDAGGVDYITKPFQQVEVLARINTHIMLRRRERELQEALNEIKVLQGILPMCAKCKKIRDDSGYWNQLETYIERHTDADVTHGLCPDCMDEIYGGQDWYEKGKQKGSF